MPTPEFAKEGFRAAVVRDPGGPFRLETAAITAPRDDEVLVRVVATGMCHTDMVARDQIYPVPQPIVLGHEGAGVVEAVGRDVTKVGRGDHVVLSFHSCGQCQPCHEGHPAYCANFNDYNFAGSRPGDGSHALCGHDKTWLNDRFFGQSSFGEYAVANQRNVVKVPRDVPLELLGPLGCGVQTGAGTVLNALKVHAGSSFAAFGAGAVGLSAVMAARAAGATTIIALDLVPSRLDLAMELGATHVVNSGDQDAVKAIRSITGTGVDYAMDSTGVTAVIRSAVLALRQTGSAAIVGASKPGAELGLDVNDLMQSAKIVRGVVEGDSVPDVFIPQLIDLYRDGRFPFDRLVKFYAFDQINEAATDSENGITLKPIIRIGSA
jgi:aryl-alcohol dehydrogenase